MTATVAGGVRPAAVAGLFYPDDRGELRDLVAGFLAAPPADEPAHESPKAVIAPHAGFRFSGPTAGYAYRALLPRRGIVERVVVIGPAHRVRLTGVGLSSAREWATPLGNVEVDISTCADLSEMPGVVIADAAHAPEHSIEVHLPFVREVFGEVPIVPLVVGSTDRESVATVLDAAWGGPETAIVVSSDLSHYLDDVSARARDRTTCTAIVEARGADVGPHEACGFLPIGGLLAAALRHRLGPRPLQLTTSADTAGEPTRVVGYGSFALLPLPAVDADGVTWLAQLAARAVDHELQTGTPYPLVDEDVPETLRSPGASFVTLERGNELLGCIGSLDPRRALWRDVAHNARAAAFEDPRFSPLAAADRSGVTVEVSVLSPMEELLAPSAEAVVAELRPGVDGLVLAAEGKRGTFLPDVWEKIPDPADFVRELVGKAKWENPWSDSARAWRYTTTNVSAPLS